MATVTVYASLADSWSVEQIADRMGLEYESHRSPLYQYTLRGDAGQQIGYSYSDTITCPEERLDEFVAELQDICDYRLAGGWGGGPGWSIE